MRRWENGVECHLGSSSGWGSSSDLLDLGLGGGSGLGDNGVGDWGWWRG